MYSKEINPPRVVLTQDDEPRMDFYALISRKFRARRLARIHAEMVRNIPRRIAETSRPEALVENDRN
jgi:hypothetical protein